MFRTTLKNLAARKLRLLTTSLAVLLGVAFMAGTLVLTDTIGKSFNDLFADVNAGTSVYVREEATLTNDMLGDQRGRLDDSVVDDIAAVDGVKAVEGYTESYAQLVDTKGEPMGNPDMGAPVLGASWLSTDELNPFDLTEGTAPRSDDEVVIDKGSADKGPFAVGDTVSVLTKAGTQSVEVVGIATFGGTDSPGGASFTMFTPDAAQKYLTEPGKVDAIKVVAEDGVSDKDLAARIAPVVPDNTQVMTGAEITKEQQSDIKEGVSFITMFLLVFALISLFVGSFIIYNSFSILVAQRSKEMALMRAIGASRRQVLGSILFESVVVGLVASISGIVAGVGVASLLKSLFDTMGVDMPAGSVVLAPRTVIVSVVVGLTVSVASAIFPARRASKVPPIAAMRDVALDTSGRSRKRVVIGGGILATSAAVMGAGLFGDAGVAMVGAGALGVFIGVSVLGPILARPISRVVGSPLPRLRGVAGNLARENAMRNPKRTSTTAAALMIGVALVGFITILASSTRVSVEKTVDQSFNGDLVVSAGTFGSGGLNPELAEKLSGLPEVDAITGVRIAAAKVDGAETIVTAADPTELNRIVDLDVLDGSLDQVGNDGIAVLDTKATANGWKVGDTIPLQFGTGGEQQFTIAATYGEGTTTGEYVTSLGAFEANVTDQFDNQILMTAADGTSIEQARTAVEQVTGAYPQAEVMDKDEFGKSMTQNMDMILNLIYLLLGLAVLIALLGIANTLALSIFERTRELGLLRAVGMTRRQLRSTVRYESVIIALLGTTLGLGIGIGFGWAIVEALKGEGLSEFAIPVDQMVLVAIIAGIAGVIAAILPARRAARLNVLEAINAE